MNKQLFERVHETLYTSVLSNGLTVKVLPKPGFVKKSVSMVVKFGSIHRHFVHSITKVEQILPAGIHHFLEHMLFESGEHDITRRFMESNALVNAYTSSNRTVYYFTTTDDLEKPLNHLLDMVLTPSFQAELIQKEQQIIEQEFNMYEDDIEQALYHDALQALYQIHPVKDEILGSIQTIRQMNQEILEFAYQVGYHPTNIELLLVGDFNPNELEAMLEAMPAIQKTVSASLYEHVAIEEPEKVCIPSVDIKKDIHISYASIALKLPSSLLQTPIQAALNEIKCNFLLEMLLGKQSSQYHQWIDQEIANDTLDYLVSIEETYGYIRITSESKKPEQLIQEMKHVLTTNLSISLDERTFLANRNRLLGSYYRMFNRIDSMANVLTDYAVKGIDVDDFVSQAMKLSVHDLEDVREWMANTQIVSLIHHS
ncbi:MAG: pitrilysin family protein [bacterium]|nr:pitrilysin family protein [bacterium]